MSLLNKMLRDLEHRRAGDEDVSPEVAGVKAVAQPVGRRRPMVFLGIFAVVVAVAAVVTYELPGFWRSATDGGSRVTPTVKPGHPKVVVSPDASPAHIPLGDAPVPAAGALAVPPDTELPEATLLSALRISAEIQSPIKSDSQSALVEAPRVASLSPSSGAQAVRVVDNALQVGAGADGDPALRSQSTGVAGQNSPGIGEQHPPGAATESTSGDLTASPSVVARSQPSVEKRQQFARVPVTRPDASVAAIEKNLREPDSRQRAAQAVESGLQSMARKQYADARHAFNAALALDPHNDRARQALLSALLAMDDKQAAEPVADEGMLQGVAKVGFALVSARLKLERGAVKEALAVLERERAAGAAHADYLALWGNALSRDARYGDAAQMYAAAVERAPANPAHHVGLGYALRNDGQFSSAQAVFQSVAEMPGLSPQLADLVEQQLGSLQRLIVKR